MYALWDRVFHTAPSMGLAVALLAASVIGVSRRALPRWVRLVAVAASALMVIDVVEDLATSGTNLGPLGPAAFALANVWIVGVSVTAWRRPRVTSLLDGLAGRVTGAGGAIGAVGAGRSG